MPKSFFERLTGSVRASDIPEYKEAKEPAKPKERKTFSAPSLRAPAPASAPAAAEEKEENILHPVSSVEQDEVVEEEQAEEGQLTVDIYDDGQNIVIQSTVAGVRPEDIDISLQEETLIIRGSRKRVEEVDDEHFYYRELYWGAFSRSIILPEEVDFSKADAAIKNGLLTIKLPKKDKGEKKLKVKVS